jgi:hypothetical protein
METTALPKRMLPAETGLRTNALHTCATSTNTSLALRMLAIAIVGSLQLWADAQAPPYSAIVGPEMNTFTIQQIISQSSGAVYFRPGIYILTDPIVLIQNRKYIGPGSADPRYGAVLVQTHPGAPVFALPGAAPSGIFGGITITGLAFDGAPGVKARGIAAMDLVPCGYTLQPGCTVLASSTISDNYFLTGLAEGIDTPVEITVIEGNQFGVASVINVPSVGGNRRHIHCVYPDLVENGLHLGEGATTQVRIENNSFTNAKGSESVFIESGTQLHIVGNQFQDNDTDTTLQINGMNLVVIDGNRFDGNRGEYLMHFARSRHTGQLPVPGDCGSQVCIAFNGNYIVRLQNNYYDMEGNNFIFTIDPNSDDLMRSANHVYIGNESGTHFTHGSTAADLTDPVIALHCSPAEVYLSTTGSFNFSGYRAKSPNCCGPTETTLCK